MITRKNYQEGVRHHGGDVYAVRGRLFSVAPGVLDLSGPDAASRLDAFATAMDIPGTPVCAFCRDYRICRVDASGEDGRLSVSEMLVNELPADVRKLAMAELEDDVELL